MEKVSNRQLISTSFKIDTHIFTYIYSFLNYLNETIQKKHVNICYIGIANNDSISERLFFKLLIKLYNYNWTISTITKNNITENNLEDYDYIFIGGGNTYNLIKLFEETKFDEKIYSAYCNGVIIGGVSAGLLCFFEEGVTDSFGYYSNIKGLNFLPYSCTPHYNDVNRKKFYKNEVYCGNLCDGYGVPDGSIVHFVNEKLHNIKDKTFPTKYIRKNNLKK